MKIFCFFLLLNTLCFCNDSDLRVSEQQNIFVPSRKVGNLIYLSGIASDLKGVVGKEVTVAQATQAAQDIAKTHVEEIKKQAGGLDNIRIVKVNGYVASEPGFGNQPSILNAYSSYLINALGQERGVHARTSIGVMGLPDGASVEIEVIIELI